MNNHRSGIEILLEVEATSSVGVWSLIVVGVSCAGNPVGGILVQNLILSEEVVWVLLEAGGLAAGCRVLDGSWADISNYILALSFIGDQRFERRRQLMLVFARVCSELSLFELSFQSLSSWRDISDLVVYHLMNRAAFVHIDEREILVFNVQFLPQCQFLVDCIHLIYLDFRDILVSESLSTH